MSTADVAVVTSGVVEVAGLAALVAIVAMYRDRLKVAAKPVPKESAPKKDAAASQPPAVVTEVPEFPRIAEAVTR